MYIQVSLLINDRVIIFQVTTSMAITMINTGVVVRALVLVLATLLATTMLRLVSPIYVANKIHNMLLSGNDINGSY